MLRSILIAIAAIVLETSLPPKVQATSLASASLPSGHSDEKVSTWTASSGKLAVSVGANGGCRILLDGKQWLSSPGVAVHCNGAWFRSYSAADTNQEWKPLRHGRSAKYSGIDKMGKFNAFKTDWRAGETKVETAYRVYPDTQSVVFALNLPDGATNTAVKSVKPNNTKRFPGFSPEINDADAETAFPLLDTSSVPADSRSMSFYGCWAVPRYCKRLDNYIGGTESGAPLVMFDSGMNTIVVSPLNHFLTAVQTKSTNFKDSIACGVSGRVQKLPPGFSQETILHAGSGINKTMREWGNSLLAMKGKSQTEFTKDETVNYLGYLTDNGAYYFAKNEPGKNFEQTMIDVADYLHTAKIPAKYLHLDANWYTFSKQDDGTLDWSPRADAVPSGLKKLSDRTGFPFAMQNSFWSAEAKNKDKYHFLQGVTSTLPTSAQFWMDLMEWAKHNQIKLYEQDFLNISFEKSPQVQTSVSVPEEWLGNMDRAAVKHGIKIAYCMPFPSDYLASTLYPSVTQIRATTDYIANSAQWRIGVNSLLAWSLGLAPFKDTFWSSKFEPGGKYEPKVHESNCELQALVSALSSGAVGPGDKIGSADRELLLKTCRSDGLLLKPDKPVTPIDRWFLMDQPKGEIWDTETTLGEHTWHYLLVADHKAAFDLQPADLDIAAPHIVRDFDLQQLTNWTGKNAFSIPYDGQPSGSIRFKYLIFAPVAEDGLAFLGEEDKFVPVSKQRFSEISLDYSAIKLSGVPGETVHLLWRVPDHAQKVSLNIDGTDFSIDGIAEDSAGAKWERDTGALKVPVVVPGSGQCEVKLSLQ